MFVGHYSVGFLLKKKFKEIPLWLLFISVQFVDILAFLFVLAGLERIAYNQSDNPFLRTTIEYVPYSHSLIANVIIALIMYLLFWKLKNRTWGLALLIGVFSHWFLDAIVHVPDVPLLFNSYKVGLGLWKLPGTAFLIELASLVLAGYYLLKGARKVWRHVVIIILLMAGYMGMFFAPEAEATPTQASIMSLTLYTVFAALAYWADRSKYV
jgi:membrane-bound metal-dependent hydrolase YbcI (DUF457 family)